MRHIAELLPEEYRGVYRDAVAAEQQRQPQAAGGA
jgi:hypothetical protein